MDVKKFHHIMFLPSLGAVDRDFLFNLATIVVFVGIYLWHTKHDHKHNKELLDEMKKIREELRKR